MAPYDLLKDLGLEEKIRDHALRVAKLVPKYVRPPNEIPADTRGTLTFGERLGLVLVTQTAFLSFFFVGGLLVMITYEAVKRWRLKRIGWPPQIYMYFVSLLISDFIQAIGSIMNIRWIHDAGIVEGSFCTSQGVIKQLGDVGVALATIAIAVQTFGMIVGRWSRFTESPYVGLGVIGFIWLFLVLDIGLASALHRSAVEPFYGNTEYWCSIRSKPWLGAFIGLEYVWLWTALLTSFGLYSSVAFIVYRQHVLADNSSMVSDSRGKEIRKLALQMVFYPIIYSFTILPLSICRFIQFAHPHQPPPFAASAFAEIMFASSGLLNVMLYAYTRPSLLPHDPEFNDGTSMEKFHEGALDELEYASNFQDPARSPSRPYSMNSDSADFDAQPSGQHDHRRSGHGSAVAGGLDD